MPMKTTLDSRASPAGPLPSSAEDAPRAPNSPALSARIPAAICSTISPVERLRVSPA